MVHPAAAAAAAAAVAATAASYALHPSAAGVGHPHSNSHTHSVHPLGRGYGSLPSTHPHTPISMGTNMHLPHIQRLPDSASISPTPGKYQRILKRIVLRPA